MLPERAGTTGRFCDACTSVSITKLDLVCMSLLCLQAGRVVASVSSGGIAMKVDGRVGEAAMFGCGCWAADAEPDSGRSACAHLLFPLPTSTVEPHYYLCF